LPAGTTVLLLAALGLVGLKRARRARQPPRRVGDYDLLAELGRGGMATTWRGRRRRDGLEVAVKVPLRGPDPSYEERFLREGRLGETLHHPNLVRILEVGEADDGTPFLAMELLPGRTLRQVLDEHPRGLPLERALAIAIAVAEALDYAHGKGVVHRDLKPENVMLLPAGDVKVMDFGVARVAGQPGLTTSQIFLGSPLYAAPEAVDPRGVDARSDLYSLGVLLFELLTGGAPFVHESVFRVLEMHQRAPLPARDSLATTIPEPVWAVVARLLEKEPARRYGSAQQLLVDLCSLADRATARPATTTPRSA
jgi:serine/threonine-protein kinase